MSDLPEFPAAESPEPLPRKRKLFRLAMSSVIFVVLMFLALAWTLSSNYRSNLEAVYVTADNLLKNISGRVQAEVGLYFNPARDLAALAASLGREMEFSFAPGSDFELFIRDGVRAKSQLVMVNVGDVEGNFVMPKMMPDGSTHTKFINWREDGTGWVRWVRRDPAGAVTEIEAYEDSSYDPRTRPWYQGALESGTEFWTDPYIFFTDRSPGVTVAYPVWDAATGEAKGVVGVDLDLSQVCDFLDNLRVGRTGRAFIHDADGKLVAYPDIEALIRESGEDLVTAHVMDLADPVLGRVYNRYQLEGPGERVVEVDGARYFSLSASLESVAGKDWTLQLVAPETDFTGFVSANLQTGIIAGAVVLFLTGGLAVLLSVQGYQSEKKALLALALQKETEGHVETLDKLIREPDQAGDARDLLESTTPVVAAGAKVSRVSVFQARGAEGRSGFLALDIFDVETKGHTQGMILDDPALVSFLKPLAQGEMIEARAPFQNEALAGFVDSYLKPLGIQQFLFCPVFRHQRFLGFLALENRRASRKGFSSETRRYLQAVSAWMGRFENGVFAEAEADAAPGGKRQEHPAPAPTLGSGRQVEAVGRRKRYSQTPFPPPGSSAAIENFQFSNAALVLAVHLPGPAADPAAGEDDSWDPDFIHKAYTRMEAIGDELGLERVLLQGNMLLCAQTPTPEGPTDPGAMGEAALRLLAFAGGPDAPAGMADRIQMGMDRGGCFSGSLGRLHPRDNLWGEAVDGATMMMECSPAGMIQCTAEAYHQLKSQFLFQDRGRFYFDNLGEVGLYLLTAKVQS